VGPVAKRRVPSMPAPAERDRSTPAQPEFLAILIHDREVAFHPQWTVVKTVTFVPAKDSSVYKIRRDV